MRSKNPYSFHFSDLGKTNKAGLHAGGALILKGANLKNMSCVLAALLVDVQAKSCNTETSKRAP